MSTGIGSAANRLGSSSSGRGCDRAGAGSRGSESVVLVGFPPRYGEGHRELENPDVRGGRSAFWPRPFVLRHPAGVPGIATSRHSPATWLQAFSSRLSSLRKRESVPSAKNRDRAGFDHTAPWRRSISRHGHRRAPSPAHFCPGDLFPSTQNRRGRCASLRRNRAAAPKVRA